MENDNHEAPPGPPGQTQELTGEQAAAVLPLCPYCEKPFAPSGARYNVGNIQLQVHYCKECRKVLNVELLQMAQQRIQIPTPVPPRRIIS